MYISKIKINNFRNFKEKEIEFTEGVNVIIGHNNAGKTNLLKALVLDFNGSKRLGIDDFHKNTTTVDALKKEPPKVTIEVTIKGKHDAAKTDNDDLVTVSNWLIKLDAEYEALLTYEFFLPTKEKDNPKRKYEDLMNDTKDIKQAWKIIEHDFLRYYVYRIWGGTKDNLNQADSESLQKIDFQFLDAIRDVERDMFSGKNTLLRDVMNYFLDYEEEEEIKKKNKIEFSNSISPIVEQVQTRLQKGKAQIQTYAKNTGASFHGNTKPEFDGSISEQDIFTALRLIIRHGTDIDIPVSHNGLGYNNLVFMSLLLAKMQSDTSKDYKGSNAKVFSILSIEEPEAHLHPAMQYKFLKFLDQNRTQNKVRQIFVSTHSTHITSAVQLDDIICLHNENGETVVGYPGKVFPNDKSGETSKKYVQRFLDATKSDMLFAQKVILVEGLAEQLLIPTLAKYINAEKKEKFERDNPDKKETYQSILLEDNHIAVINVGGRYFEHFLQLFDTENSPFAIFKKVVCITDRDPTRKKKDTLGAKFEKCYPFEYNQNSSEYEYQDNAFSLITQYDTHPKIRFFSQDEAKGKTFEYDLVLYNQTSKILSIDGMTNEETLKELMDFDDSKNIADYFDKIKNSDEKTRVKSGIESCSWSNEDKKKAIVAAYYLNSVGKGENALNLSVALEENLSKKGTSGYQDFQVPQYIKDAIEWICK